MYSCQISINLEFSPHILENPKISNFIKIRPVGAELFHGDGQTNRQDMTKLTIAFCDFANAPKNFPVLFRQPHSALPGMGTQLIAKTTK